MCIRDSYMALCDGEGAPQIYNAANSEEQAGLGFNAVMRIRRQSPLISKNSQKQADRLYFPMNMGFIKPISSRPTGLDGFDVHMAGVDEIHAAKTREDVYKRQRSGTSRGRWRWRP